MAPNNINFPPNFQGQGFQTNPNLIPGFPPPNQSDQFQNKNPPNLDPDGFGPNQGLPILPKNIDPEPPRIKFNGRTYILTAKVAENDKKINKAVAKPFTDLVAMTLKYGITALEAEHKVKVESLNDLKIIQEVEQDKEEKGHGKLFLQYTYKDDKDNDKTKTVKTEITDDFRLNDKGPDFDQKKVCAYFDDQSSCHKEHDTAKKAYIQAMEVLKKGQCLIPSTVNLNEVTELKSLAYDDLPECIKNKYSKVDEQKENEKNINEKDAEKTKNPSNSNPSNKKSEDSNKTDDKTNQSQPEPIKEKIVFKDGKFDEASFTKEELDDKNIPYLAEQNSKDTDDKDSSGYHPLTRWKDYLLNGKIRIDKSNTDPYKNNGDFKKVVSFFSNLLPGTNKKSTDNKKTNDTEEVIQTSDITLTEAEAKEILKKIIHLKEPQSTVSLFINLFTKKNPNILTEQKEQIFLKRLILLLAKYKSKQTNYLLIQTLNTIISNKTGFDIDYTQEENKAFKIDENKSEHKDLLKFLEDHIEHVKKILLSKKK